MKTKYVVPFVTGTALALLLTLLAIRLSVPQKASEQFETTLEESEIHNLVRKHIGSEYADRAALVRALQEKGMTLEEFRQEVEARALNDLVKQRIQSEFSDRAAFVRALQERGITYESFRQQVKREIERNLSSPSNANNG